MKINWIAIFLALFLIGILVWVIVHQIKENHMQDDPMLHHLKQILTPVDPDIARAKMYKSNKSYTINKEKIFLKVKDENGEYYPTNMLVYVTLHEWAHAKNKKDVGHTEEFKRIFDELLVKATETGAFNPSIPIISSYGEG